MSNPFKKIKRAVKKGTKKIKKGLGSLANKVADKLVPKELAPFLPMLAPLFMGAGAGPLLRYLGPQLLTALSSGKQTGDIDLTSQALTGIASALSDPARFDVAGDTKFDTKQLQPGDVGFQDPAQQIYVGPGDPQFEPGTGFYKDDPFNINRSIDAQGNILELPGDIKTSGIANVPDPNFKIIKNTPTSFKDLSFGDKLKTGINETLDFMQGANIANKGPFGDPILDAAGNPLKVVDAGFMANLPRRAITQGILSAGPLLQSFEAAEEEEAALAAEQAAQQEAMNQARQSLTDYYLGLSDPEGRFGTLPIFAAEGGTINSKRGLVDGPGGYAGHDDIDDIIRKLIEDMAIDFSKAGGGNPPSIVGGTDFKKRKLPKGMEVIRSIKPKKAEGGIMNAAPGMPQGMQVDGRNGTFIPMGVKEKADDVPAMLSKNEFVMTADAVRAAGGGSVEKGAQRMYDLMNSLEARV